MAAALPVAAIAMQAIGTVAGGIGEMGQQYSAARQDIENGRLSLKSGEEEAMDVLRQARFEQGGAAADMAGSGLAFGGSIASVLADSADQAELDIGRVRARAGAEANNYYASAKQRKKAGKGALVGSLFSAVSGAVSGASALKTAQAGRAPMGSSAPAYRAPIATTGAYAGSRG